MYSDIRSKSSNCDKYSLSDVKLLQLGAAKLERKHGARLAVLAEELEFGITCMQQEEGRHTKANMEKQKCTWKQDKFKWRSYHNSSSDGESPFVILPMLRDAESGYI